MEHVTISRSDLEELIAAALAAWSHQSFIAVLAANGQALHPVVEADAAERLFDILEQLCRIEDHAIAQEAA